MAAALAAAAAAAASADCTALRCRIECCRSSCCLGRLHRPPLPHSSCMAFTMSIKRLHLHHGQTSLRLLLHLWLLLLQKQTCLQLLLQQMLLKQGCSLLLVHQSRLLLLKYQNGVLLLRLLMHWLWHLLLLLLMRPGQSNISLMLAHQLQVPA
jgi:hypothetical protein